MVDRRVSQHTSPSRLSGLRDPVLLYRMGSVGVTLELCTEPLQLLIEHLLGRHKALPIHASRSSDSAHSLPGQLQVLPLVNLVD